MLRPVALPVAAVLLLTGSGECENVETCAPTRVEIERVGSAYLVTLRSGELPLRGREVVVRALDDGEERFGREVELDDEGEARVTIPADVLAATDEVVASFPGDRTFCPARDSV